MTHWLNTFCRSMRSRVLSQRGGRGSPLIIPPQEAQRGDYQSKLASETSQIGIIWILLKDQTKGES